MPSRFTPRRMNGSTVVCSSALPARPMLAMLPQKSTVRVSQVQLVQPFLSMLFAVPLLGETLDAVIKPWKINGGYRPYKPVGCQACNGGYKGRVGIYQVMPISDEIQQIILRDGNAVEIARQSELEGVKSLRQSGLQKVRLGITSLEEVLSTTNT